MQQLQPEIRSEQQDVLSEIVEKVDEEELEKPSLLFESRTRDLNHSPEEHQKQTEDFIQFGLAEKVSCDSGLSAVAIIHLSVVNWGGEEVARVEVLPSDTVVVGQLQIEDQIGVPPRNQRLVHGEQQLDATESWSAYGVLDWSSVQVTVIEVSVCWLVAPPPCRLDCQYCSSLSGLGQLVRTSRVGPNVHGREVHN